MNDARHGIESADDRRPKIGLFRQDRLQRDSRQSIIKPGIIGMQGKLAIALSDDLAMGFLTALYIDVSR